jgi:hypothetical protein
MSYIRAVIIVVLLNIAGCSTTRTDTHEETVTRTQDPQSTYDNGERTEVVSKTSSEKAPLHLVQECSPVLFTQQARC